jgi:hypothetical protein
MAVPNLLIAGFGFSYAESCALAADLGGTMAAKSGILVALVKQANGATDLSREEKQTLLRDAAWLIMMYRKLVAVSGSPVMEAEPDIAFELEQFADYIDFKYVNETKEIMLDAADTIRTLCLMLGIKLENVDGSN